MNILHHYKKFTKYGDLKNGLNAYLIYIHYIGLRLKYGIGIADYYNNNLYNKSINHDSYLMGLHTYIHSWKNVSSLFAPNRSKPWLLYHWIDYMLSKLYCRGVDAMDYYRYEWYRLSISGRREFITEGGLRKMVSKFNGSKESLARIEQFTNKAKFNNLFHDFINRKWFINIHVDQETFIHKVLRIKNVICKPLSGGGGKGVIIKQVATRKIAYDLFVQLQSNAYIIEEIINQHEALHRICPTSVNTIRVYSVMTNAGPTIISAALRIGNGKNCTDNYSSGGFVAEIDIESGLVISRAVSQDGLSVYIHPSTKCPIIGTMIPLWEEVKRTVIIAHTRVPEIGYIGWDTVVCNDGRITFIEGNTNPGVELQQHAPLKGKKYLYDNILKFMR